MRMKRRIKFTEDELLLMWELVSEAVENAPGDEHLAYLAGDDEVVDITELESLEAKFLEYLRD